MSQIELTETELINVDDWTNLVMDKLRDVLVKYESHYPDWNEDALGYNLDDKIYAEIYNEIRREHERRKFAQYYADELSPK